jgi:hypothetical protein
VIALVVLLIDLRGRCRVLLVSLLMVAADTTYYVSAMKRCMTAVAATFRAHCNDGHLMYLPAGNDCSEGGCRSHKAAML